MTLTTIELYNLYYLEDDIKFSYLQACRASIRGLRQRLDRIHIQ